MLSRNQSLLYKKLLFESLSIDSKIDTHMHTFYFQSKCVKRLSALSCFSNFKIQIKHFFFTENEYEIK